MDIAITKMSSKGQIVIPAEMRKGIKEGEKLILIKDEHRLILRKASDADLHFKEDMDFARKTEAAWQRIEAGKGVKMDFDRFIDEMKKW